MHPFYFYHLNKDHATSQPEAKNIVIWETCLRKIIFTENIDPNYAEKKSNLDLYEDEKALIFIIEVLCGLQSRVIGETEIRFARECAHGSSPAARIADADLFVRLQDGRGGRFGTKADAQHGSRVERYSWRFWDSPAPQRGNPGVSVRPAFARSGVAGFPQRGVPALESLPRFGNARIASWRNRSNPCFSGLRNVGYPANVPFAG